MTKYFTFQNLCLSKAVWSEPNQTDLSAFLYTTVQSIFPVVAAWILSLIHFLNSIQEGHVGLDCESNKKSDLLSLV